MNILWSKSLGVQSRTNWMLSILRRINWGYQFIYLRLSNTLPNTFSSNTGLYYKIWHFYVGYFIKIYLVLESKSDSSTELSTICFLYCAPLFWLSTYYFGQTVSNCGFYRKNDCINRSFINVYRANRKKERRLSKIYNID